MKVNTPNNVTTHQGGKAAEVTAFERLKRTVLACLLFEDSFYEDGIKAVERIEQLCAQCSLHDILTLAISAAHQYRLRHVPLQLIVECLKKGTNGYPVSDAIAAIITRPDQMTDLLALYWKQGKKPLAHQLKRGLAKAFRKFDEYQLSKYDRDDPIKLRDILFLCRAKPDNEDQAALWKRLINKELKIADTWETRLSAGQDKKQSFQELLENNKMGKLAILRNLRNMRDAGIDKNLVASRLLESKQVLLPFQYIAAAKECMQWEDIIDQAQISDSSKWQKLPEKTLLLVDVSGSMDMALSAKGTMTRMDAACGLAIILRASCEYCEVLTFSNQLIGVPPRSGMALRDAIVKSQDHQGTYLGNCLRELIKVDPQYDRLIVITDEQSGDDIPQMKRGKNYILNVGNYEKGIGDKNQWLTISGFSEASVDYIREVESQNSK